MQKGNRPAKTIYTLGSSNRNPQEFVALLNFYQIDTLIDVRSFPTSKFEHFKQENLGKILREKGIEYIYLGKELGGYRKGGYETYTKTQAYKYGLSKTEKIAEKNTCSIMCAERLPWRCHRRFIGDSLKKRGWKAIHVIDEKRIWESKS